MVNSIIGNKFVRVFNKNATIFSEENTFENVWKMTAILSRSQCVKHDDKVKVSLVMKALHWCHNGLDSASNHQPHDCLLKRLLRRGSKKTSKLRVTGLCVGSSPETGESLAQRASNAENVSNWWLHHKLAIFILFLRLVLFTSACAVPRWAQGWLIFSTPE